MGVWWGRGAGRGHHTRSALVANWKGEATALEGTKLWELFRQRLQERLLKLGYS